MKPIGFRGGSLDDFRAFPRGVMREAGYQLDKVQHGLLPSDASKRFKELLKEIKP